MGARRSRIALYLDTSAFMKLLVEEEGSARVRAFAEGPSAAEVLLCSRLGRTEASVSLARLTHLGRLAAQDLPDHLGALSDYWDQSIHEVELSEAVLEEAVQMAQRFPLRTYDAIHLASAREARRMLRGVFDGEVHFLAFDEALIRAAQAIGFVVPGRAT